MLQNQGKELPLKSTEPPVLWKKKIEIGKKALENFNAEGDRFVSYYNGKFNQFNSSCDYDKIENRGVNLVYTHLKQVVPESYDKNPTFYSSYSDPEGEVDAEIAAAIVNDGWVKHKTGMMVIRPLVKSTNLRGVGATKTFWNDSIDPYKDFYNDSVIPNDFRTVFVPINHLIKDPNYKWESSPFICYKIHDTIENIAKKFDIKDKTKIAASRDHYLTQEETMTAYSHHFKIGTYYEVEDRINRVLFYIVDGIEGFAAGPFAFKFPYDSMYDFLCYEDIPEPGEPHSTFHFFESQLLTINENVVRQLRQAKISGKILTTKGNSFDENEIDALLDGAEQNRRIHLEPDQNIDVLDLTTPDYLGEQVEQKHRADAQLISKNAPRHSDENTATEAKINAMNVRKLSSENLVRLDELMQSIAKKWVQLAHQNYSDPRTIKLDRMNQSTYSTLTRKFEKKGVKVHGGNKNPIINFNNKSFDPLKVILAIKPGSSTPQDEQSKIVRIKSFLSDIVQLPNAIQVLDFEDIINELLKAYDLEKENITISSRTPVRENSYLEDGRIVTPRINEDHELHLKVHSQMGELTDSAKLHIAMHKQMLLQINQEKLLMTQAAPQQAVAGLNNQMLGQLASANQGILPNNPAQTSGQLQQDNLQNKPQIPVTN